MVSDFPPWLASPCGARASDGQPCHERDGQQDHGTPSLAAPHLSLADAAHDRLQEVRLDLGLAGGLEFVSGVHSCLLCQ
jgi:hypothetical protein